MNIIKMTRKKLQESKTDYLLVRTEKEKPFYKIYNHNDKKVTFKCNSYNNSKYATMDSRMG